MCVCDIIQLTNGENSKRSHEEVTGQSSTEKKRDIDIPDVCIVLA